MMKATTLAKKLSTCHSEAEAQKLLDGLRLECKIDETVVNEAYELIKEREAESMEYRVTEKYANGENLTHKEIVWCIEHNVETPLLEIVYDDINLNKNYILIKSSLEFKVFPSGWAKWSALCYDQADDFSNGYIIKRKVFGIISERFVGSFVKHVEKFHWDNLPKEKQIEKNELRRQWLRYALECRKNKETEKHILYTCFNVIKSAEAPVYIIGKKNDDGVWANIHFTPQSFSEAKSEEKLASMLQDCSAGFSII